MRRKPIPASNGPRLRAPRRQNINVRIADHHRLFRQHLGLANKSGQSFRIGLLRRKTVAAINAKEIRTQPQRFANRLRRPDGLVGQHRHPASIFQRIERRKNSVIYIGVVQLVNPVVVQKRIQCALHQFHKLDYTYVYDGVFPALDALKDGRRMAVLTNKPVRPAEAICEALGLSPYFFRIYGGNSFATKKPDPEGLTTLIREAEVLPEETVMVGDSDVDILTARRAKTWAIGCRYGLSSHTVESIPSDCLADSPRDWISALDAEKIRESNRFE